MSNLTSLKNKYVVELEPTAPFNFDATMHKPDHFPSSDNAWVPGSLWQTMLWRGKCLGLEFENQGNHISPWEQKIYSKLFSDRDPEKPVSADKLMRLFNKRFAGYRALAVHYIWEDLFWKRKHAHIEWLEQLIRL